MQGHKYSYICNLWGKFLPAGMICSTIDTISIPVGEMYLHARMFCALAHTSSIPMGSDTKQKKALFFLIKNFFSFCKPSIKKNFF